MKRPNAVSPNDQTKKAKTEADPIATDTMKEETTPDTKAETEEDEGQVSLDEDVATMEKPNRQANKNGTTVPPPTLAGPIDTTNVVATAVAQATHMAQQPAIPTMYGAPTSASQTYSMYGAMYPSVYPSPYTSEHVMATPSPAAIAAGAQIGSRTIYMGNLKQDMTYMEFFGVVRGGPIETGRLLPDKCCGFLTFVRAVDAYNFFDYMTANRIMVGGRQVKVGWSRMETAPEPRIREAIAAGATRNVYIRTRPGWDYEFLRTRCICFGDIDTIKTVPEKGCAFVHFTTIAAAVDCIHVLPTLPEFYGLRVSYGKDRSDRPFDLHRPQSVVLGPAGMHDYGKVPGAHMQVVQTGGIPMTIATQLPGYPGTPQVKDGAQDLDEHLTGPVFDEEMLKRSCRRKVYLSNLPENCTLEALCNAIRGGALYELNLYRKRREAFVTFINPDEAAMFYQHAIEYGTNCLNLRVKVGWAPDTALDDPSILPDLLLPSSSRNLYIAGQIRLHAPTLRSDFEAFGKIEQVHIIHAKNTAFINFSYLPDAVRALAASKLMPQYMTCRRTFGKDRCSQALRFPKDPSVVPPPASPLQAAEEWEIPANEVPEEVPEDSDEEEGEEQS